MTAGNDAAIRAARVGDSESFRACLDRVARERIFITVTEVYPEREVRTFVDNMIARDLPFYVATAEDERVVGWCDITVPKPRPERLGFDHVGALAMGVDAEHRRRGIGERLILAALDHARRIGLERIELQVYAENAAAIALYRMHRFEVEGRKRCARKLDGRYDDLVQMALLLPAGA